VEPPESRKIGEQKTFYKNEAVLPAQDGDELLSKTLGMGLIKKDVGQEA
jgi:hypothetical protein